jgi:hypothetical protein
VDLLGQLEASFNHEPVSIVEFAESPRFCNRTLYPRQKLLLKMFFLEELDDDDLRILEHWQAGGRRGSEIELSPDVLGRMETLRNQGFKHFREIILVGGRRCSKGFITGLSLAKKMFDTMQLQDPGRHYGIDVDKEICFSCVAASLDQAKDTQYADFSSMVNSCYAMQRYIHKVQHLEFSVATESDLRKLDGWKRQKRVVERDISKLRGKALPANARTIRGLAMMAVVFDEFAHFQQGESDQSDSQVYAAAKPSLAQFGRDAMVFCNPVEAPVWMADLSFKPIGDIEVGDKVVGWQKSEGKVHRELCESEVLNIMRRTAPIIKVTMDSGRSFRCTPDHRWLTLSSGGNKATHGGEWYAPVKVGRKLAHVVDSTPELDIDLLRDAAWLGGMFDGEGYAARAKQLTICQSRTINPKVCEKIERVLDRLGFNWVYHASKSKLGPGGAYHILGGAQGRKGMQAIVDFANWTQPAQLHKLQAKLFAGRWRTEDRVVAIEPDGEEEVVALTTSTVNYVCNGYASRNCNSSPYSKVGTFFERYETGMATDNGIAEYPEVLTLRFPSWALYEGWWEDPEYKGPQKCIMVSPDWDPDTKNDDGSNFYTDDDRAQVYLQRQEEQSDPIKYKVETRGQFAEVVDAYLMPEMIDRMFAGRPVAWDENKSEWRYEAYRPNFDFSTYENRYYAHLDPSSTTAGFGFALGHTEIFELPGEKAEEHVVFDIIKRWNPKDFPGGAIDWDPILAWVLNIANLFRPVQISFDMFNTDYPITWLNREFRKRRIETRVFKKVPTSQTNWDRAEIFRTALYRALIHAPHTSYDEEIKLASDELKFLQEIKSGKIPRVEKQDTGPVQTKDMADCYDDQTEVLTDSGWKLFKDVGIWDEVATRNPQGELEWKRPHLRITKPYKGGMMLHESDRLNFCVTPTHNMLVDNVERPGSPSLIPCEDLSHKRYLVPKTASYEGDGGPSLAKARLIGFWLADGRKIKPLQGRQIRVTQTKPSSVLWFDSVLADLGLPFSRNVQSNREISWSVKDKLVQNELRALQEGDELRLPRDCYGWRHEAREGLLEGLLEGDGIWSKQQGRHHAFVNTSRSLIDDVQRLLVTLGANGRVRLARPQGTMTNKGIAKRDLWSVHLDTKDSARLYPERIERVEYDGLVYCLTVDNHTLLVRRGDTAMWCGNCMMEVVEATIGDMMAKQVRQDLGTQPIRVGSPGGYPLGGQDRGGYGRPIQPSNGASRMAEFYERNQRNVSKARAERGNPARRFPGRRGRLRGI